MKKIFLLFLTFLMCFSITSCNKEENTNKRKIVDIINREVTLPDEINNVV